MQRSRPIRPAASGRTGAISPRSRLRAGARAFAVNLRSAALCRAQLSFGAMWASESAATVAVSVVAYRDAGPAAVALVAVARMLPAAIVAPFAATLADRHRREHVLVGVGLVRAATLAGAAGLLVARAPSAWVYASIAAATLAHTLYRPAHSALLPALCRTPEEHTSANVVRGLLDAIATLAGPLGAAGLLVARGAGAALAACALASLASALLLIRLRYEQPRHSRPVSGGGAGQVVQGMRALGADPGLSLIAALAFVQTFLRGSVTVLVVVLAIDLLGGGDADVGMLNAAMGLGAVAGSLMASMVTWNARHARCLGIGVALWGIPLAVIGGAPEATAALLLFAAIGVGNALVDVGAFTLPARLAPDAVMARTFAALEALWTLGVALGAAATWPVVALLGGRGALLALGLIGPAAVATAWPALRALDRRMAKRDANIALLHQVATLRSLPTPTIEQLAAGMERVVFGPGATVLEEGQAGESVYIVTAGHAELTRGGRVIQLGPGGCFGELELLRSDPPYTATVRAADEAALHVGVLRRDRFAAAVAGLASSAKPAENRLRTRLPAVATAVA
jgi:Major Facilitator Superfamily/Cyclic nucleotide-binding domain